MVFEVSPGEHWLRFLSFPGRGSGKREVRLADSEMKNLLCYTNGWGVVDLRSPTQQDAAKLNKWFPDLNPGDS
jgi:hypothetical protein